MHVIANSLTSGNPLVGLCSSTAELTFRPHFKQPGTVQSADHDVSKTTHNATNPFPFHYREPKVAIWHCHSQRRFPSEDFRPAAQRTRQQRLRQTHNIEKSDILPRSTAVVEESEEGRPQLGEAGRHHPV